MREKGDEGDLFGHVHRLQRQIENSFEKSWENILARMKRV
jgi:hypothetical protein